MEVRKKTRIPGEEDLILKSHAPTDEEKAEWGYGEDEIVPYGQEDWQTPHSITWYGHAGYTDVTFYLKTQQDALDLIDVLAKIVGIEYD